MLINADVTKRREVRDRSREAARCLQRVVDDNKLLRQPGRSLDALFGLVWLCTVIKYPIAPNTLIELAAGGKTSKGDQHTVGEVPRAWP